MFSFAGFAIEGTIQTAEAAAPVGYAEAYFIDNGIDYHRGSLAWETRIGTSDASGRLDQGFDYGWCEEISFQRLGVEPPDLAAVVQKDRSAALSDALLEAWANAKIPQPFAIEIRAEGLKPLRVDFDLAQLSKPDDAPYRLDLGTVSLVRESTP